MTEQAPIKGLASHSKRHRRLIDAYYEGNQRRTEPVFVSCIVFTFQLVSFKGIFRLVLIDVCATVCGRYPLIAVKQLR